MVCIYELTLLSCDEITCIFIVISIKTYCLCHSNLSAMCGSVCGTAFRIHFENPLLVENEKKNKIKRNKIMYLRNNTEKSCAAFAFVRFVWMKHVKLHRRQRRVRSEACASGFLSHRIPLFVVYISLVKSKAFLLHGQNIQTHNGKLNRCFNFYSLCRTHRMQTKSIDFAGPLCHLRNHKTPPK